jgi:cysteine sulfinate desulfinase/cysteine desulfurase-like protein
MRKVYFDHNATTPVHPEVAEVVRPFLGDQFGNPSSIHWAGRDVRKSVEDAREKIADFYGCRPLGNGKRQPRPEGGCVPGWKPREAHRHLPG